MNGSLAVESENGPKESSLHKSDVQTLKTQATEVRTSSSSVGKGSAKGLDATASELGEKES